MLAKQRKEHNNMKVKEAKIGKKCLYRGHILTIKNIKSNHKLILSNGNTTKAKYIKPI